MSEHFSALNPEEKKKDIERYKRWHKNNFTELFISHLEDSIEKLVYLL